MAWPCITRACCINRFWTELDKADIAVPLVFTKYSDVQHLPHHPQPKQSAAGAIAIETQPHPQRAEQEAGTEDGLTASVMRQDFKAWRVRPEPSCKPRREYQRSAAPFNTETQYQKDYKPWPIPKKNDHPWIPKPSPGSASRGPERSAKLEHAAGEAESGVEKSEIEEKIHEKETKEVTRREKSAERDAGEKTEPACAEARKGRAAADALNRQLKEVMSTSSSYRYFCQLPSAGETDRWDWCYIPAASTATLHNTSSQVRPVTVPERTTEHIRAPCVHRAAAATQLNQQPSETIIHTSPNFRRTEFKAYKDVKPTKPIKAPSQYKPPGEETNLETSYSATFKGEQVKAHPADNKAMERRRIRSLYSEPSKASPKVDKPASHAKSRKTSSTATTAGKMAKKTKEKQISSSQSAKKKPPLVTAEPRPEGVITKKSKEISNRLAEAKQ
uniref:Microtubule-associated protein 6b n=1 Tax=Tetraodon nigroviridis TaxID=99883 RepID=H3C2G8_TETNG